MRLDKKERLILANQYKILEKLYPDEAEEYANCRKALEYGFSLNYGWLARLIFDEMTEDKCQEVIDILNMYRAITFSYRDIDDKSDIDTQWVKFQGFDGNEETDQYSYAVYFISDLKRFDELTYDLEMPDLNSHCPVLDDYRAMLAFWKSKGTPNAMNKDMLIELLEARNNHE
jgi:uncharacterized protein YfbU (UPF0304 family)